MTLKGSPAIAVTLREPVKNKPMLLESMGNAKDIPDTSAVRELFLLDRTPALSLDLWVPKAEERRSPLTKEPTKPMNIEGGVIVISI